MTNDATEYVMAALNASRPAWAADGNEELVSHTIASVCTTLGMQLSDQQVETLTRKLLHQWNVTTDVGEALTDRFIPWLTEERRSATSWARSDAYNRMLNVQQRPPASIQATDQEANIIVELLGDPTGPPFSRRGLVLGDVQSGKTSSYLAVLCKACDLGYRMIVVLAGQTDRLRAQTQERVDEGFVGRRSVLDKTGSFGIEEHAAHGTKLPVVQSLTTISTDFKSSKVTGTNLSLDEGIFCVVVKKNKTVLEALAKWFDKQRGQDLLQMPLLLLDDESDSASINTKADPEADPTAINGCIREILSKFSRSSYLAYTATPFANAFIDHEVTDDLFPRDFILPLSAPSNYVGVTRVFGEADEERPASVLIIEDAEDYFPLGHKSNWTVEGLPDSLVEALDAFTLHNALRDLRGDLNSSRSMLINVSRLVAVHKQLDQLVKAEVNAMKNAISIHARADNWGEAPILNRLNATYKRVFPNDERGWDAVRAQLPNAVRAISVKTYNSAKGNQDREVEGGSRIVAIGGSVLSRGVTLPGLGISYFYQSPRASDTLLQMGRWFGYRDGYEDLCRLWIDAEVALDFRQSYEAITDLREDLNQMIRDRLTPRDFGLAVQRHPEALMITARNKMHSAEKWEKPIWTFARRMEMVRLDADPEVVDHNLGNAKALLERIAGAYPHEEASRFTRWEKVPYQEVQTFFADFRGTESQPLHLVPEELSHYIGRLGDEEFPRWDVVVMGTRQYADGPTWGAPLPTLKRTVERRVYSDAGGHVDLLVSGKRARLAAPDDVAALLPEAVVKQVSERVRTLAGQPQSKARIDETRFYEVFARPVLMLYLIRPQAPKSVNSGEWTGTLPDLVVAPKIILPGTRYATNKNDTKKMFILNSVAAKQYTDSMIFDSEDDDE